MKTFCLLFIIAIFFSCGENKTQTRTTRVTTDSGVVTYQEAQQNLSTTAVEKDISWTGTIQGNVPVFLHYKQIDSVLAGEIYYLNTKDKKPIKLIGTLENDHSLRLLEFENDANISGIITGTPSEKNFKGYWFSPKTRKSLDMKLTVKDTSVISPGLVADTQDIFGTYNYGYSAEGPQGFLTLSKLKNNKALFELNAVTSSPARNIADISADTVTLKNNGFEYSLPGANDCAVGVKFYKGFVYVYYTKFGCAGQFGHNASAEGFFLKK